MQIVNTNNYLNIPLILPNMGRWNTSNQYQLKIKNNLLTKHIYNSKTQTGFGAVFKKKKKKKKMKTYPVFPPA